jgi:tetratricopeptide (TPR) repeat protein
VADTDDKKDSDDASKPGFDPKPVQLGGESIVDRLMPYRKKIGIAILLGLAVWAAIAVVFWLRNSKREKNTGKIVAVVDVAQREVRTGAPEPDPANPAASAAPTFASNKERADAVLDAIVKKGANVSPTYKASLLMQAGKVDEAIAEYRKYTTGRTLDNVLAREGLGIALETKAEKEKDAAARQKGLEEALSTFQTMQPDAQGPRRAYSLYHQGRILGLLGKTAEAKAALEKAKELGGPGQLADMIEERLATLGAS